MTTQKKLKRAVRSRMTKTGERYAAARRALVEDGGDPTAGTAPADPADVDGSADRPAPAPGLLPGYVRVGGRLAEVSALANALAAAGVTMPRGDRPYSEAMLYGLGGGVGGGYFLFRYTGAPPVAVIGTRHLWQDGTAFLTGILERLAIAHRVTEAGSRKAADGRLDAVLEAGQPSLAWVDEATLPYRGLPEELRTYIVRIVGVAGREVGSGRILVDDRAATPIPIDAATFSEARGLISSNRRRLLSIEGPGEPVDLAAAVREAILDGHRARTGPRIRNFGLPALAKWADQVVDPRDPKAWPTALAGDVDLVRVLRWAHGAIGDGADRGVFATFLDEAAEILGRPGLVDVANRYRALAAAWNGLAAALLPDAVPSLREIRTLERSRWAAFDDPAGPDLDRFVELTRRIEADEMRQMRAMLAGEPVDAAGPATFVVPDDARPDLFADLASRIREIHAAEVEATAALEVAAA